MDGKVLRRGAAALITMLPVAALPVVMPPTAASAASATSAATAMPAHGRTVPVIVRAAHGHVDEARQLVEAAGGTITRDLSIIDGFAADIPASALATIADATFVDSVTEDASVHMS